MLLVLGLSYNAVPTWRRWKKLFSLSATFLQSNKRLVPADTSSLRVFRQKHHSTFETICLQLDRCNNWKALGLNINIPDETLQQIATSTSCAKTVLEIIENRKPHVTVKEMQDVLKGMQREDVCNVLDKYLPGANFC